MKRREVEICQKQFSDSKNTLSWTWLPRYFCDASGVGVAGAKDNDEN